MSTNINSTEQIVEINAGDQITNVNIVSQSTTQVISGEQVVTVDVNAGTIPAAWGSITGTLSNQTDLQNALNAKQNNITLTTTGTSGAATLIGATLNIPNYTDTGLTSVGLAMPEAFTVSGSPLTSNGTITVLAAGTGAQYIKGDGSLGTFPTTIDQSLRLIREVYNNTGATLTKGTIVYINGGQGNLPTVTKALATGDATSAQTFGVVQSDITNHNNGYVVVAGGIDNLDTQSFSVGAALYLSPTVAGTWTTTKPYAPDHLVYIGTVIRSHPTQGVVEVRIANGYELSELHDVSARYPNNNDGLFYNSTSGVWENKTVSGALGYTPVPQSRIITINGTAHDLSADRTYNVGTVTQIAASGGTGISVAGSPVTGSGTITITNTAPDQVVGLTGAGTTSISGTYPNFTITSNDQYTGTVTSVAASGGTGISISGSPVTGSGTISITNTAPDQIVSLTGAGTTSISGTYPNFTVTSNDQYVGTVTSVNATVPTGFEVSGVPITTSGTVDIKFASGYSLPTNAKQTQWDDAYAKRIDSLTVTGNSGSATLTSNVLNVPTYTLTGLGGEPAITAGTTSQYWRGDKSFQTLDTSVVPENGNVYFTEPRVRATVLSGLNITGGSISASDSVLNAFGKVQNQINGLIGGSIFQSTWNASTNTPSLASGVGTKGYYYIVSVAGTTNLDGITDWQIGDWAIFDGTVWRKVDNTDAVVSVNGYTGVVSLVLDDLADVSASSPTDTQLLRFNGTTSKWYNWTPTYISGNETITLSGDVTGSGTTAITTVIGTGKVTNAMLAGSINYAKMDSATVPTWNQDTTGNAATADKWKTARTLTIGATGKSVDGSANVTWSLSEIGAAPTLDTFSDANTILNGGFFYGYNPSNIPSGQSSGDWGIINMPLWDQNNSAENYKIQIASNLDNGGNIFIRKFRKFNTVLQDTWYNLWNSGNDGSGSGLDADLLDGQHGTYYAAASSLSNYLLLTGGTLSGDIKISKSTISTLRVIGGGYDTSYNTSLRSDANAQGILQLGNNGANYILVGNTAASGFLEFRVNCTSESLTSGTKALTINSSGNAIFEGTISASNFSGSSSGTNTGDQTDITGNAATATKLATARTLTIGSTGRTFDGSTDRTWTLADIGAAAALSGTINTIAYWDSASTISSLSTATYPSLTELSYIKGVTSAIQTQINSKAENLGTLSDANIPLYGGFFVGFNPSNIPSGQSNQDWGLLNAPLWGGNVSGENYKIQFAANLDSNTNIFIRKFRKFSTVLQDTWYVLWNSGNDGSDSGLDADLLDGQHGSYYATASSLSGYLPLSGGTLTGALNGTSGSFNSTMKVTNEIRVAGANYPTNYNTSLRSVSNTATGILQFGNNADNFILIGNTATGGYLDIRTNCSTEAIDSGSLAIRINANATTTFYGSISGTSASFSSTISASNFSGSSSGTNTGDQTTISGNAGSATILQTARTLTIGSTGKTFNGSANVSWTISEIGAAPNNGSFSDANALTTGGFFTAYNASNVPSGLSSLDMGLCNIPLWGGNSSGERYTMQLFANLDTNSNFYIRKFKYFGSVNLDTWFLLLHSGNYSSYALPLSGGTLTGNLNLYKSSGDGFITITGASGTTKGGIYLGNNGTQYASLWFDNATNDVVLRQNYSSGSLIFGTNSSDKMRLTSAGELWIGYTSDQGAYLLQVNGSVYATAYYESSDIRLKDVLTNSYSENFSAIEFMWKDKRDNKNHWGYAAQDVLKYIPDAVQINNDGYMTVNYNEAHTWKIAQLESEIKELKIKLNELGR